MKKTLSLILAVMMLLGCMSVTAFATTDNSTDITLTVAKALTYEMVIPEDVTNLSNFGIYSVGLAKVTNVKNATDKTVISYTAETADFKSEGKTDIPASYYTDLQGTNTFPTTAVEVYKNKADVASLPTMYVGISENAWNAAENGTYTATVTFNFEAKEEMLPQTATIAELLGNDGTMWSNGTVLLKAEYINEGVGNLYFLGDGFPLLADTVLTRNKEGNYSAANEFGTITFIMDGDKLTSFVLDGYCEKIPDFDGTYIPEPTVTVGSVVNGKSFSGKSLVEDHNPIRTVIEDEKLIIRLYVDDAVRKTYYEIPLSAELSIILADNTNKTYIYPHDNGDVSFTVRKSDGQCVCIIFGCDAMMIDG